MKIGVPYQSHSETSFNAATEITGKIPTLRHQVLSYICTRHSFGATDEEIQIALNMNPSTQRPRRIELVNMNMVRDSGLTRKTTSGRNAVVWVDVSVPIEKAFARKVELFNGTQGDLFQ
jgi:hypothetical protein